MIKAAAVGAWRRPGRPWLAAAGAVLPRVGSQAYGYDALGRMVTSAPSGGTAAALSYTGPGNTLASDGSSTYTWDGGWR